MNIALFAGDQVGLQIVKLFREKRVEPGFLILDSRDPKKLNSRIRAESNAKATLYSEDLQGGSALAQFRSAGLDLGILAWWPYLIKDALLNVPKLGFLNFHPSLLPYNRGKHPNFWSLVEASPFGVSLHFIDAGVDSGDIAFQRAIPKTWEDTGGSLHEAASREIVELFRDNFEAIVRGAIPRRRQPPAGSFHRGSELEAASRIDLSRSYPAHSLLNLIRARTFPPHPAAWFEDDGEKYEVRIEIRRVPHE